MSDTIRIKVGLSIGFAGSKHIETINTDTTVEERDAMSPEDWNAFCEGLMREWAYNYIEMWYDEEETASDE